MRAAVDRLGLPVVVKPVMSSSGHGQSAVRTVDEVEAALYGPPAPKAAPPATATAYG